MIQKWFMKKKYIFKSKIYFNENGIKRFYNMFLVCKFYSYKIPM